MSYRVFYSSHGGRTYEYEFLFQSKWAAIQKARAIHEYYGLNTEVINSETGEVVFYTWEEKVYYEE